MITPFTDVYDLPPRPENWGQGVIIFSSVSLRMIIIQTEDFELIHWMKDGGAHCIYDDYQKVCVILVSPYFSYYNILSYLECSYTPPRPEISELRNQITKEQTPH